MSDRQFEKVKSGSGFIAALDRSGGSTPKSLQLYGIEENAYSDDEMFPLIHAFQSRIITSPSFRDYRILGQSCSKTPLTARLKGSTPRLIFGASKRWSRSSRSTRGWPPK
jgi:fructose-bisphosphate aldolase class I